MDGWTDGTERERERSKKERGDGWIGGWMDGYED